VRCEGIVRGLFRKSSAIRTLLMMLSPISLLASRDAVTSERWISGVAHDQAPKWACSLWQDEGRRIPRKDPMDATAIKQSGSLIIFVIGGGPGAGKLSLATRYGLQLVSPRRICRDQRWIRAVGCRFERIMRWSCYVPADVIVQLFQEMMSRTLLGLPDR